MRPLIIVALTAIAVHLPNLPIGKELQEDAGVFMYTAQRILDGGLPYRDVWDHKPPLIYVLDAIGLMLGGGSPVGVWALQALGYIAAAMVGYRAFARALGHGPALFGTLAWLLGATRMFLFEDYFTNFVQIFAAPLQFTALALFLDEERRRSRTWRSVAIGVTAGLTVLLTPLALGLWTAIGLFVVGGRLRRGALRSALARGLLMASGAVLPVLVAGGILAVAGVLPDAWDQAVRFNSNYSAGATWPDRGAALTYGLLLLGSTGFLFVALIGAASAVAARRDRTIVPPGSDARLLLGVALLAVPFEALLGSSTGRYHSYYWLIAVPSLGVLAAFAAFTFERWVVPDLARRLRRPAAVVAAVSLIVGVLLLAARPVPLMARVAASRDDGINASAIAYLREHTGPDDTVLVWGSRAAVNFGAQRRSPTRYVYQYAPLSTRGYDSLPHTAELARILREQPPTVIIDAWRNSAITPPLEVAATGRFDTQDPLFVFSPALTEIARSILERYERVDTVGPSAWPVYRLRGR